MGACWSQTASTLPLTSADDEGRATQQTLLFQARFLMPPHAVTSHVVWRRCCCALHVS